LTTAEIPPEDGNFEEIDRSTVERLQHHCDLMQEDLDDVIVITRRKFKYPDGSNGYQIYYAMVGDLFINAQALNSVNKYFQENMEELVHEQIIPLDNFDDPRS